MLKIATSVALAAMLLASCGQKKTDDVQGPAVSTSEAPHNQAVDTTPTADATAQTPGANSFTEGQARGAIEAAGFTNVGPLSQDTNGVWKGTATKDGAEKTVSVDYKGTVATL